MKTKTLIILIALVGLCVGGFFVWKNISNHIFDNEGVGISDRSDDNFSIALTEKSFQTIKLYYYNPDLDQYEAGGARCSSRGIVEIEREIPITQTPIQDAINLLILGQLTDEEKAQGITPLFPLTGFSLKGVSLKEEELTLEFNDPNYETIGGSCRVGILLLEISATAKQFPQVKSVKFTPENLFQP